MKPIRSCAGGDASPASGSVCGRGAAPSLASLPPALHRRALLLRFAVQVWASPCPAPARPRLAGTAMDPAKLPMIPNPRRRFGLLASSMPAAFAARVGKKRVSGLGQGTPGFTAGCCKVWLRGELWVCTCLGSKEWVSSQSRV